jgi:hypothetical protein
MTHERRLWNVRTADELLDAARDAVTRHARPDGTLDAEAGRWHLYRLRAAATCYRNAGLGVLADRVTWLADSVTYHGGGVVDEWRFFDRLNAGGCGVA